MMVLKERAEDWRDAMGCEMINRSGSKIFCRDGKAMLIARRGCAKKEGEDRAIGCSKGRLSAKIHATPMRSAIPQAFVLAPG